MAPKVPSTTRVAHVRTKPPASVAATISPDLLMRLNAPARTSRPSAASSSYTEKSPLGMLGLLAVNKTSAIKALDRPGCRWLAAAGASVAETWTSRRPTFVRPLPGKTYLHQHMDGAIVLPHVLSRRTPGQQERATHDIFCFGYTPRLGDTVLDIGAGCGEEAVTFSRLVGPTGRVISVEAHPDTYRRLVLTCKFNNLNNVTPVHLAVTDAETTVTIDDGTIDGGSISARISGAGKKRVPAITIDKIIRDSDCSRVDLLKMNIEGAEQLAIRGIAESVEKVRHVVISCHDFILGPGFVGGDPAWFATYDRITGSLRDMGFTLAERRLTDPRPELPFYVYGSRG
jgi:FkbM family methyltransferase